MPKARGARRAPTKKAGTRPALSSSVLIGQIAGGHWTGTISKPFPSLAMWPVAGKGAW